MGLNQLPAHLASRHHDRVLPAVVLQPRVRPGSHEELREWNVIGQPSIKVGAVSVAAASAGEK